MSKDWKKKKLEEKECPSGYVAALRKIGRGKNTRERSRQVPYCKKIPKKKTITDQCDIRNDGEPSVTGNFAIDEKIVNIIEDNNINELCKTKKHPGTEAGKLFCLKTLEIPKEKMPNLADTIYIRNADTNRFLEYIDSLKIKVLKKYVEACTLRSTQNQIYGVTIRKNISILNKTAFNLGYTNVLNMLENLMVDTNPYERNPISNVFEINEDKVKAIIDALPAINMSQPIIISNDKHIIDGHHRWATMLYFDLKDQKDIPIIMEVYEIDMPIQDALKIFDDFCGAWGECKRPKKKPN